MRLIAVLVMLLGALPLQADEIRVLAYRTDAFFFVGESGPTGFEKELLDYYCRAQGCELVIEFVDNFADILPAIQNGEADVASATITITPEREELIDFSASYFPLRVMLVEPEGAGTASLDELAGAKVATIRGTTLERLLAAIPDVTFEYVEGQRELFEAVSEGRAEAMAVDSAVAFTLLPEFPSLALGIPISEVQHYGFATASGSPLAGALSRHIAALKSSGIYYRLLEKYLGEQAVQTVKAASQ